MSPSNEQRPPLEREAPRCSSTGANTADRGSLAPAPRRIQPLLVDATAAAEACDLCERTWRSLDAQGLVPEPIKVGRRRLWSVEELGAWVRLGCPNRERFEQYRRSGVQS